MSTEIEIKIQIDDIQYRKLINWLSENIMEFKSFQHNEFYLDNPKSSFSFMSSDGYKDATDFLRIRFTEDKTSVCYKHWHSDPNNGRLTHCDEYESEVSNGEALLDLFTSLGYTDKIVIRKKRTVFKTADFEICLDDVEELGKFVEIELRQQVESVSQGLDLIYQFLRQVGITHFRRMERGYVSMLWNPNHDFGEDIDI